MLLRKILQLAPIVIVLIGVNYFVDPSHLFSKGRYEAGLAQLLRSGYNVANVSNYNERLVQKYYISSLALPNETVVLGSSRSMQIGADLFGGKSFFNNSVSDATLEDYLAIYEMYHRRNLKPALLILELDPWLFRVGRTPNPVYWLSIKDDYERLACRAGLPDKKEAQAWLYAKAIGLRYSTLISPSYFQVAIHQIFRTLKNGEKFCYVPTGQTLDHYAMRLKDGSLRYGQAMRVASVSSVRAAAETEAFQYQPDVPAMSETAQTKFEKFVKVAKHDGVRVIFFLPPFHPDYYGHLRQSGLLGEFSKAEDYYRRLALEDGIVVLGSFDPQKCSCGEEDFYDALHPKPSAVIKIFRNFSP